jgi:hypothetical protein
VEVPVTLTLTVPVYALYASAGLGCYILGLVTPLLFKALAALHAGAKAKARARKAREAKAVKALEAA